MVHENRGRELMTQSCPYGNSQFRMELQHRLSLHFTYKWNTSKGISPEQVSGLGCTYHSHEVTPRGRAPGVLDLGSVARRVGKETVLFHGDL